MPPFGADRYHRAEDPPSRRVGVEGADPFVGADGSVLGGGIRRRMGGAVAFEAQELIGKHIFIIHNLKSNNNFTEKTA